MFLGWPYTTTLWQACCCVLKICDTHKDMIDLAVVVRTASSWCVCVSPQKYSSGEWHIYGLWPCKASDVKWDIFHDSGQHRVRDSPDGVTHIASWEGKKHMVFCFGPSWQKKWKGYPWKMWNFEEYFHQFERKRLSNSQRCIALHMYPNFVVKMPSQMGLLGDQTLCTNRQ